MSGDNRPVSTLGGVAWTDWTARCPNRIDLGRGAMPTWGASRDVRGATAPYGHLHFAVWEAEATETVNGRYTQCDVGVAVAVGVPTGPLQKIGTVPFAMGDDAKAAALRVAAEWLSSFSSLVLADAQRAS